MLFRVKYLIAGMAPASELYEKLKNALMLNVCYQVVDVSDAEVLGPYPEDCGQIRPVVPVTVKLVTFGNESTTTVIFDIFMLMTTLRSGELSDLGFQVGLEELVAGDEPVGFPSLYTLGELPEVEL
jgi:hypothetical protein